MNSTLETVATERRQNPRMERSITTFVHRLAGGEALMVRAHATDTSAQGVGLLVMIPLPQGTRLVVDVPDENGRHELLLCQVKHCDKSDGGRFGVGAMVLERQPGSAVTTRIPPQWMAAV